jgi:hypothetical protein
MTSLLSSSRSVIAATSTADPVRRTPAVTGQSEQREPGPVDCEVRDPDPRQSRGAGENRDEQDRSHSERQSPKPPQEAGKDLLALFEHRDMQRPYVRMADKHNVAHQPRAARAPG